MTKAIITFALLIITFCSFGQSNTTININIKDPVQFENILLPGSSTKPLGLYSAFAVNKNAAFYFEDVSIGAIKKLVVILLFAKMASISCVYPDRQ